METQFNTKEVIDRLAKLQKDMNLIREYLEDITLTNDDLDSIDKAREDLIKGKTRRV